MNDKAEKCYGICIDWYRAFCMFDRDKDSAVLDLLEVAKFVKTVSTERDALLADLAKVCADVPNPCPVCGHWRPDQEKPGCELIGLHCAWTWRGVQEVE